MARPVRENVFGGGGGNLDIINPIADAGKNILDIFNIDFGESSAPPVTSSTPTNNGHVPTGATSEPKTIKNLLRRIGESLSKNLKSLVTMVLCFCLKAQK